MIEPGFSGLEAGDDVAQTFPIGELPKAKGQELIILGESASGTSVGKKLAATGELFRVKHAGDLRKDRRGWLHRAIEKSNAGGFETHRFE